MDTYIHSVQCTFDPWPGLNLALEDKIPLSALQREMKCKLVTFTFPRALLTTQRSFSNLLLFSPKGGSQKCYAQPIIFSRYLKRNLQNNQKDRVQQLNQSPNMPHLIRCMKVLWATRESLPPSVADLMWFINSGFAPNTVKNFLPSALSTVLSFWSDGEVFLINV